MVDVIEPEVAKLAAEFPAWGHRKIWALFNLDHPDTPAKSRRTISLATAASDALSRHRVAQAAERLAAGERWLDRGIVFTTNSGASLDPRNFHRQWHGLLERAGLAPRPLHEARHAAASLMLSEGVPLKVVQETLGHSTIVLTADLYGHLMPNDSHRVAEAMDRAFGA